MAKDSSAELPVGVVVETFMDKAFAQAAISLLESEGIEAELISDDAGGELPNLDFASGVQVMVATADVERAKAVLSAAADD